MAELLQKDRGVILLAGKKTLTERENFFIAYNHGKPAWVPNFYEAYAPMGASVLNNQGDYMKGGKDMFGAKWICTEDTGWQAIPDPYEHVLEDITEWKKYIEFPEIGRAHV